MLTHIYGILIKKFLNNKKKKKKKKERRATKPKNKSTNDNKH